MPSRRLAGWIPLSLGAALALAGCIGVKGSGHLTTRQVTVGAFSRVEASASFDVTIGIGSTQAVSVRTDDNLTGRVDVHVSGGVLHIGLTSGSSIRDATLHADVTATALAGVDASGASKIHLSGRLQAQSLDLVGSGASTFDGAVELDRGSIHLSGASSARLSGSVSTLEAQLDGASEMDTPSLQVAELNAELSGASNASVSVSNTISAEVSGASTLRYGGNPRFVRKDVSGASSIERL
jgi:hypothetical protein